jgi:predicted molibdopterin-dependent oxidoreductase YjgC
MAKRESLPNVTKRANRRPRLTTPLVREDAVLRPASWDEALDRAAAGLSAVRDTHGGTAIGMFSCSKAQQHRQLQPHLTRSFGRRSGGRPRRRRWYQLV